MRVETAARSVTVGDKVFTPNSRKPQEVTQVVEHVGLLTLYFDDTQWVMKKDYVLNKYEEDETEGGEA